MDRPAFELQVLAELAEIKRVLESMQRHRAGLDKGRERAIRAKREEGDATRQMVRDLAVALSPGEIARKTGKSRRHVRRILNEK